MISGHCISNYSTIMACLVELHTNLSSTAFLNLLNESGTYKDRSNATHTEHHKPVLSQNPTEPIEILLLGDSMLERFKTTGRNTPLGSAAYPLVMNAGVGGDKISNVLYRLGVGLWQLLSQRSILYAVIQIGSNNLKPKKGLNGNAVMEYALLIEAMQRAVPGVKVLVTGLMQRKDVLVEVVTASNDALDSNNNLMYISSNHPPFKVFYLPPCPQITTDHLEDHAHLNATGYALFSQAVEAKLEEMGRKQREDA